MQSRNLRREEKPMKVQLKGTIGQEETKQSIEALAIYDEQNKTLIFQEKQIHYFLNLEQMTLRKETEDAVLLLHWDLAQQTTGSYELESMGRTFDFTLKTRKIEVSSSHFLIEYQLEDDIITFELTWEEVA